MMIEKSQLDLPLDGSSLPLPVDASLWVVAAGSGDARHIREHLLAASRDERGAFFVREADGTLPIGPGCVVGVHEGGRLHLFAPPSVASPDLPLLLCRAFASGCAAPARSEFEDLLLVRLWGNGAPTASGSQADRPLGRGLSRLQTSDMRANPFIFRMISGQLLDRLGEDAAVGLRAMLRRSWASSVITASRHSPASRDAALHAAWKSLRTAAREFERAGLNGLAERCAADADDLGAVVRTFDGSEPLLPGLRHAGAGPAQLPRTAFRCFRCIGLRVRAADGEAVPAETRYIRSNVLIEAGSVTVRDLKLGAILGTTTYPGLLPRVRVLPPSGTGTGRRIRVWLDEEHKALLDLPIGRTSTLGDRRYVVSVRVRGQVIEPPFRATRQGRPADFHADTDKLPGFVTVRVSAGGHSGSFEVAVG